MLKSCDRSSTRIDSNPTARLPSSVTVHRSPTLPDRGTGGEQAGGGGGPGRVGPGAAVGQPPPAAAPATATPRPQPLQGRRPGPLGARTEVEQPPGRLGQHAPGGQLEQG